MHWKEIEVLEGEWNVLKLHHMVGLGEAVKAVTMTAPPPVSESAMSASQNSPDVVDPHSSSQGTLLPSQLGKQTEAHKCLGLYAGRVPVNSSGMWTVGALGTGMSLTWVMKIDFVGKEECLRQVVECEPKYCCGKMEGMTLVGECIHSKIPLVCTRHRHCARQGQYCGLEGDMYPQNDNTPALHLRRTNC